MKERLKKENVVSEEIRKHPKRSTLTFVLLFTLILAFVEALRQSNWVSIFFIVVIAVLICLPAVVGKLTKIEIPVALGIFSVLFIYAALFLGEIKNYYTTYWWWDILLHMSSGLAFGIIGFIILYILYKTEKIKTSPKMIAMFSFVFALAIGALWEIVEFSIDLAFKNSMQTLDIHGCGLFDTMKDLIDDSIGALFAAIMGYFYLKKFKHDIPESLNSGIIVKSMATEFKKDNPRFFKKK